MTDDGTVELDRIIVDGLITTLFQPIVELDTRNVVAYEALSRGPAGSILEFPDQLFAAARRANRVAELDLACARASIVNGAAAGITLPRALFVNLEPATLVDLKRQAEASGVPPLVIEITERALLDDPAGLMRAVAVVRDAGHAIAVDDLGAKPASLAFLPVLRPDVIKLDMALVQAKADQNAARIMSAISWQAANHPAVVLAEGVETEQHMVAARALGATHGQGWLFGRPSTERAGNEALTGVPALPTTRDLLSTPFDIAARGAVARPADRALIVQASIFLEARARSSGDSAVVFSTFQRPENIDAPTRSRYEALSRDVALVVAMAPESVAGLLPPTVRKGVIRDDDPMVSEWTIIVLTADYAAVLAAKEADPAAHGEGVYDFVFTHERAVAVDAARSLLARIWG